MVPLSASLRHIVEGKRQQMNKFFCCNYNFNIIVTFILNFPYIYVAYIWNSHVIYVEISAENKEGEKKEVKKESENSNENAKEKDQIV